MGLLCDILDKRFTLKHPPKWFVDYVGGGDSSAGVNVSAKKAMQYTPFWAAVRIISGTLASLPFMVYRRLDSGGKVRQANHPIYQLLHNRPNDYMDVVTFLETRQAHVLTYGNGYAEIQRDGGGRPVALWPLLPNRTQRKVTDDGTLYYEVRTVSGETVTLPDYNVLHIKGLGFDGFTGYDVVRYHKEAIGYGIAVKEYGSRFFSGGASPGGVLEHPENLSEEAQARLRKSWESRHQGLSHSHRIEILEEGMTWKQTGVEPEKAQAIETQKFTVDDCSRIFNIPPHKLASLDKATFSNIEEQNLDFLASTMLYWFRKWEQEVNYKLFTSKERGSLFAEILVAALLRGNIQSRYRAYAIGRQWGWLSVNMILEMENMNPIGPEGDEFLVPMNMRPAGAPPDGEPDPAADDAHRQLLISQCQRLMTKEAKLARKSPRNGDIEHQRQFAREILIEPAQAYATHKHITLDGVLTSLDAVIARYIGRSAPPDAGDAERMADAIINELGDDHALA